jgi:biotin carboxylase
MAHRILLCATTTGYQTRSFGEAAERLGVELVFATDRCHVIDDPWRDAAIPIRFHDEDASVEAIVAAAAERPIDGVLALGDRPTVIAARVAATLGLPWHSPDGAAAARNKLRTRERLRDAGLPVPWFLPFTLSDPPSALSQYGVTYPCVLKPVALSASRGVMRADDPASLDTAIERLRALLQTPELRAERDEAHDTALLEGFIPGPEYAVEGVLHHGVLRTLAIFEKPDPLFGPFFEETIYLTPPDLTPDDQAPILRAVARASDAIGLRHGPIHAECRVNADGVFVLEVGARPIGGLCARALRFVSGVTGVDTPLQLVTLEELLLRHALGESLDAWQREDRAAGVMMIPIPRRGVFRGVDGVDAARDLPHVEDVRITAKTDQVLVPLPEGGSYLGFIFARADRASEVEGALRHAHARLRFAVDDELAVRRSS